MSALLHLGEASHKLLCADAEIGAHIVAAEDVLGEDEATLNSALIRARRQLTEARADLAAIRFAMRSNDLAEALEYHDTMAASLREGARLARMLPGRGLHLQADQHVARAAALRVLIGTTESPLIAAAEKGGGR